MSNEHVNHGMGAFLTKLTLALLGVLLGGTATARSAAASDEANHCQGVFDPQVGYPALSELPDLDLSAEAGIVIYLQRSRPVAEVGDCLFEVDQALEVPDTGTFFLLFEFVDQQESGAMLHVSDESGAVLERLILDEPSLSYLVDPEQMLGFEWMPTPMAPTKPVIVSKPTGGKPK